MSCFIGGRGVGGVIFKLHLGVGHPVLCQMEGVGLNTTFSNAPAQSPPPPPVLFDQSLTGIWLMSIDPLQ